MNISNRLSEDVKIIGEIHVKEDLFIDCEVEGEIHSKANLTVGENAQINGKLNAENVTIFGAVNGNINTNKRCELKETSNIEGDITASVLKIVEGAAFNGLANVKKK